MNIKISIVLFILISFLNMGAISNVVNYNEGLFDILETNALNISEFEENGAKLQYKIIGNIKEEKDRIKGCLINIINGYYREINENEFEIYNDDFNTSIKIWYQDKYTYVEIILVNKDNKYTTGNLKNILKRLENKKSENQQYFFYYKGKEKELSNELMNKFINKNNIQKVNLLEINNGYTGTGYLSNGDKINFALIKYNTGSHIIISTPIIFTTY